MAQEHEGQRLVLVGVDGSDESEAALAWAIDLARQVNAEAIAVHVLETQFLAYYSLQAGVPVQLEEGWREGIKRAFEEEWTGPLKESGLKHRTLLLEGRPATMIAEAAEQVGAYLVVVGRRGRGGVAKLLLGSVSSELAQRSAVPVVVVPDRGR